MQLVHHAAVGRYVVRNHSCRLDAASRLVLFPADGTLRSCDTSLTGVCCVVCCCLMN